MVCGPRTSAQMPSLAERVFQKYQAVLQREDISEVLPDIQIALKTAAVQRLLLPAAIKLIARSPGLLRIFVPGIDEGFLTLLIEDPEVNTLINDPDVHLLLQNPTEIDSLLELLRPLPNAAVVRITPTLIELPDVGEALSISVDVVNALDVAGYQVALQFDPSALQFVSWQQGSYLNGEDVFVVPALVEADQLSFAAAAPTAIATTAGDLFTITFEVGAIKASTLSLTEVILATDEGKPLPLRTQDSKIIEQIIFPWDVNKDGVVNILDLTLVAARFGEIGSSAADVNGDNVVNVLDLTLVATYFSK